MRKRLGFRTGGLADLHLDGALELISGAGFRMVELCMEHHGLGRGIVDPDEITTLLRRHGLELASISYHGKKDPAPHRLEMLARAVDLGRALGSEVLVTGSPLASMGSDESLLEGMRMICDGCSSAGMLVAWETEPGTVLHDLRCFFRLREEAGTDRLRLNLDLGHMLLTESDPVETIRSVRGLVAHVHLEGMRRGEHRDLLPDEGDLDARTALDALDSSGYDGPLVVDLFEIPCADRAGFLCRAHAAAVSVLPEGPG